MPAAETIACRRAWIVVPLLLAACAEAHAPLDARPADCGAPREVRYSCDPLPDGMPGCRGEPPPFPGAIPDPEATFAPGCEITMPYCHPWYPSSLATCTCREHDGLTWVCPL